MLLQSKTVVMPKFSASAAPNSAVGDELALGKRAARLSGLLAERVDAELARMGLTKAQYEILAVLRASGDRYRLRPPELSRRLLLSSGGTSNLLRRRTSSGLVRREPDPSDARSSGVALTDEGLKAAQAALLRSVSPATTAEAIRALRAVLLALGDVG